MSEHAEQALLFAWARLLEARHPELRALHAVQNWAGVKGPAEGARRKREGVRAGVPDVHLPVPRCGFASLYIEMKRIRQVVGKRSVRHERTRTTPEQQEWHTRLRELGNAVEVCYTAGEAQELVLQYVTGRYSPLAIESAVSGGAQG